MHLNTFIDNGILSCFFANQYLKIKLSDLFVLIYKCLVNNIIKKFLKRILNVTVKLQFINLMVLFIYISLGKGYKASNYLTFFFLGNFLT